MTGSRKGEVIGNEQRSDAIVTVMAVICFLVVLWTMWAKQ
jgi:hypothetical protein